MSIDPRRFDNVDDWQDAEQAARRAAYVPPEAVQYVGLCGPCAWQGPARSSNLTALRDFDRHALTADHHYTILLAPAADEPDALHCDYCAVVESAADLTPDWNGETGNHLSCEKEVVEG